jgi:hypothetical protein
LIIQLPNRNQQFSKKLLPTTSKNLSIDKFPKVTVQYKISVGLLEEILVEPFPHLSRVDTPKSILDILEACGLQLVELSLDLVTGLRVQMHSDNREVRSEDSHQFEHFCDLNSIPLVALLACSGLLVDLLLTTLYQLIDKANQTVPFRQLSVHDVLHLIGEDRDILLDINHMRGMDFSVCKCSFHRISEAT